MPPAPRSRPTCDAHGRHKHGAIDHDLRRDFGVDPDELRERFAFYTRLAPLGSEQP